MGAIGGIGSSSATTVDPLLDPSSDLNTDAASQQAGLAAVQAQIFKQVPPDISGPASGNQATDAFMRVSGHHGGHGGHKQVDPSDGSSSSSWPSAGQETSDPSAFLASISTDGNIDATKFAQLISERTGQTVDPTQLQASLDKDGITTTASLQAFLAGTSGQSATGAVQGHHGHHAKPADDTDDTTDPNDPTLDPATVLAESVSQITGTTVTPDQLMQDPDTYQQQQEQQDNERLLAQQRLSGRRA